MRTEFLKEATQSNAAASVVQVVADNWLEEGPHHRFLNTIGSQLPISAHFLSANLGGPDELDASYLDFMVKFCRKFKPTKVSEHLAMTRFGSHYFHDLLPFPWTSSFRDSVCRKIDCIQKAVGGRLLIENLSYYEQLDDHSMTEADFLSQLHDRTGCGFLLDINNLANNEKNFGVNARQFIQDLNPKAVEEIHLAKSTLVDHLWIDDHSGYPEPSSLDLLYELESGFEYQKPSIIFEQDNNLGSFTEYLSFVAELEEEPAIKDFKARGFCRSTRKATNRNDSVVGHREL